MDAKGSAPTLFGHTESWGRFAAQPERLLRGSRKSRLAGLEFPRRCRSRWSPNEVDPPLPGFPIPRIPKAIFRVLAKPPFRGPTDHADALGLEQGPTFVTNNFLGTTRFPRTLPGSIDWFGAKSFVVLSLGCRITRVGHLENRLCEWLSPRVTVGDNNHTASSNHEILGRTVRVEASPGNNCDSNHPGPKAMDTTLHLLG